MAINEVDGLSDLLSTLSDKIQDIQGRSKAGLWVAGLEVMALAKTRTPVLTGNLRGSGQVIRGGTRAEPFVDLSFSANYAIYVHENLEAYHRVGQAKFLESAVWDKRDRIIEIIKRTAKV